MPFLIWAYRKLRRPRPAPRVAGLVVVIEGADARRVGRVHIVKGGPPR